MMNQKRRCKSAGAGSTPPAKLARQETKVALFVKTLPYSGAIFVQVFPRECTATFLEGHRQAFEFFGGVQTLASASPGRMVR